MGKCRVRDGWFARDDGQGRRVSEWAKKHSDHEVFCSICTCTVGVGTKGFQAIEQHASTVKHQQQCRTKLAPTQLRLRGVSTDGEVNRPERQGVQIYNVNNSRISAELIWAMKCIASNYSAASCDGIGDVFKSMFPNSVPDDFSLSRTKFRYFVADALGPYFRDHLTNDLSGAYYTLIYDETTNAGGRKELQIFVRYWSNNCNRVISQHLQTFFIGQATAKDIQEKLNEALDNANLSRQMLLMLGSDGPNVNKKVARLINDEVIAVRQKSLVEMGTCNIHIVHNAYVKGLSHLGENASDLVLAVYYFFNGWPVRWDDFTDIQQEMGLPNNHFLKHVPSRWLTLENSAQRLLQQWAAVNQYFLQHIPKKRSKLSETNNYKKIVKLLKSPTIKAELLFVCSTARIFTQFTGTFQREEPLVHVIFAELRDLIQKILGRICHQDKIPKMLRDVNDDFFKNTDNLLPLDKIACGDDVRTELLNVKERDKLHFLNDARKFYSTACKHVLEKTQIAKIPLLKHLRCLHPDERTTVHSCNDIVMLAKTLPFDLEYDTLLDEWKLLQHEKNTPEIDEFRVDTYWYQFFTLKHPSGNLKYPTVTKVVKAALALSHGSADVERGFSTSGRVLTEDRASMSERTLNAILGVKDVLKQWDNKPHYVPITKQLLGLAKVARQRYRNYLEEEKRNNDQRESHLKEEAAAKAAEEKKKRKLEKEREDIEAQEKLLKEKRVTVDAKRKGGEKLFEEATERLKKAIESKNFEEIELAQAMLQGVSNIKKDEEKKRREAESLQKSVEKRKSEIIASVTSKKLKTK